VILSVRWKRGNCQRQPHFSDYHFFSFSIEQEYAWKESQADHWIRRRQRTELREEKATAHSMPLFLNNYYPEPQSPAVRLCSYKSRSFFRLLFPPHSYFFLKSGSSMGCGLQNQG